MWRGELSSTRLRAAIKWMVCPIWVCCAVVLSAVAAPQAVPEVPPDATPQIQQISPNQGEAGANLAVTIQGRNFSAGAYVSSVSSALQVESSKRVSSTQLEVQLRISASAQPSTVSLLVSNPASRVAEVAFTITAKQAAAPPAAPPASAEPPKTATPSAPPAPPVPSGPPAPAAQEVKPAAPATPVVPVKPAPPPAPIAPPAPVAPPGPEVAATIPSKVAPGFDVDLKITGRNFSPGTKVSFANPGIRVMGITTSSGTELTVHIKVAGDATPGAGSLFVVNPDDREVEVPFEVTGKGGAAPPPPAVPASPHGPTPRSNVTQRYEAFHLGNPAEILHTHGKIKGALVVDAGAIKYEEGGQTLLTLPLNEIKEIKTSSLATATFHITMTSGKTYHFAPGSLHPADARNEVDSLRKALPH